MLKGISPLVAPDLLAVLSKMGHGDELVLSDAHFPGHSVNNTVFRADGSRVVDMLEAILPLFAVDTYVADPLVMIETVKGDTCDPAVANEIRAVIAKHAPEAPALTFIDRFDFYDRAKKAFAVVMTGETRKYGCLILKKGVTPA